MNIREHYGITDCPNPRHDFSIGRLVGVWQMASDYWCVLDGSMRRNYVFHIGSVDDTGGSRIYQIYLWKLSIQFGIKDKAK